MRTLDGVTRKLVPDDLVIADAERAVALAAIMGGEETEVTDETTEVLLEAANFEPLGILASSERHALRTAGSNRWEKGVDPYLAEPAAKLASRLIVDLAGARMTGSTDVQGTLPERPVVHLRPERASALIGLDVPPDDQRKSLEGFGFDVSSEWDVTVPTWRARDVTREIDLIEEVARPVLDRVPLTMPKRRHVRGRLSPSQRLRRLTEDVLVGAGLSEAYTWSLAASDPSPDAIRLPDPMTADQAVLRTTPRCRGSSARCAPASTPARTRSGLFEIARVYLPSGEQLPEERWRLAAIVAGGYAAAKGVLETLYDALKLELRVERSTHPMLHPGKTAATEAGILGELHPTLLEGTWGAFELDLETLFSDGAGADRLRGRHHVSGGQPGHRGRRGRGRRGGSAGRDGARGSRAAPARGTRVRRVSRRSGRREPEVGRDPSRVPVPGANAHGRGGGRASRTDRRRTGDDVRRRASRVGNPIVRPPRREIR